VHSGLSHAPSGRLTTIIRLPRLKKRDLWRKLRAESHATANVANFEKKLKSRQIDTE
jgi:hypothetical protein